MKNTTTNDCAYQTFQVRPIGFVRSPYREHGDVRHTHRGWTEEEAEIEILPEYAGGLRGLTGYSHIIVIFWIHRADEWKMPKHHHKPPHVKVFATRMPRRPNPIGMSVVELLGFSPETGRVRLRGLDALDGTPVLDIKPYIPHFDSYPSASLPGWVSRHLKEYHHADGHRHSSETEVKDKRELERD